MNRFALLDAGINSLLLCVSYRIVLNAFRVKCYASRDIFILLFAILSSLLNTGATITYLINLEKMEASYAPSSDFTLNPPLARWSGNYRSIFQKPLILRISTTRPARTRYVHVETVGINSTAVSEPAFEQEPSRYSQVKERHYLFWTKPLKQVIQMPEYGQKVKLLYELVSRPGRYHGLFNYPLAEEGLEMIPKQGSPAQYYV
jgi:hypothetical protein